jgi:hypothetical protein
MCISRGKYQAFSDGVNADSENHMYKIGHNFTWRSLPMVNRLPLGNVLIEGAVYLSGLTFQATKTFADTL